MFVPDGAGVIGAFPGMFPDVWTSNTFEEFHCSRRQFGFAVVPAFVIV